MPNIYRAIRSVLGGAFMGDTSLAKALPFSDPAIFDDRLISLLQGLNLLSEPFDATESIRGSDIRSVFNAMHATSNSARVNLMTALNVLSGQFVSASAIGYGARATNTLSGGFDITSDSGDSGSEFRIARLGPKVWSILVRMKFSNATPITMSALVRWTLNVPDFNSPASPFNTFFSQLPLEAAGPIFFTEIGGCGNYGTLLHRPLGICRGSGSSSSDAFIITANPDPEFAIYWRQSSDASDAIVQLGRTFSGVVIIP